MNNSAEEYVTTGGFHNTNTVESHFAVLKRGVHGMFTTSVKRTASRIVL